MFKTQIIIILYFFWGINSLFCQIIKTKFSYPIDREPIITGNYGEIRPNHFHAGLDFSTNPTVNLPIKSIDDGYISRIKISSGGYGKVLYITHPNGYVSVYAHQKKYASIIETYVKQKQISLRKNEIELFLNPNEIVVKKGEVVGYTGNSGSSTGPHLHFEIRDEKSEIPLNPLLFYTIKDAVKPIITHIGIYNTSDTNQIKINKIVAVINKNGNLNINSNTIILNENTFAIAFSGYDEASASTNKNNIYEAKVFIDNKLIYHHQLNNISFDNARYVNFFSEKANGIKFQKCFTPNCYNINIYKCISSGGKIVLKDTLRHKIYLEFIDENGNKNELNFSVKTTKLTGYKTNLRPTNAFCNKDYFLENSDYKLNIKAASLTENANISFQFPKNFLETSFQIKSTSSFLLHAMQVSIKPNSTKISNEKKLIVLCNNLALNTKIENGWLIADSKNFGTYSYTYDTVSPTIVLIKSKKKNSVLNLNNSISFTIDDKLSGIKDYNIYINDLWYIAEYDAKSSTVTCYFDELTPKGKINIRFEVVDKVDNISIYKLVSER